MNGTAKAVKIGKAAPSIEGPWPHSPRQFSWLFQRLSVLIAGLIVGFLIASLLLTAV